MSDNHMEFDKPRLDRLYQFCLSLTVHQADAYDLLQTGLEKYLRNPPQVTAAAESYMYKILHNTFIDQWRQKSRVNNESYEDDQHSMDFDIATLESIYINKQTVNILLAALEPEDQEILFLWAVEEYSTREVAEILSMPKGTVLSRIYRLRKKLQAKDSNATAGGGWPDDRLPS